jgi:hypothetical protein
LLHREKKNNKIQVRFVDILAVLADGSRGVGANSDEGALSVIFIQSDFSIEKKKL